jgi:hypothetical protein
MIAISARMWRYLSGTGIGIFAFIGFIALEVLGSRIINSPQHVAQSNPDIQRQVLTSSLDLVKMLFTLNTTLLAGFGVLALKMSESINFSSFGIRLISVTFGCLAAGMWLAYDSYATALKLYATSGVTNVENGSFSFVSGLEILAILVGAACYAVLLITAIQTAKVADANK